MRLVTGLVLSLLLSLSLSSQSIQQKLEEIQKKKEVLNLQLEQLDKQMIEMKHTLIIEDLKAIGLPSDNYIEHKAMILEYSEEHEQAKWVAHMILTDIIDGKQSRTNDFRVDPLVTTGTTVQSDYFLTDTLSNGKVKYDGFGYDRGHLAPSADFKWSLEAMSETYFYSNMSPQLADFNRESWAQLEDCLRKYVAVNEVPLFVITAPVLSAGLDTISRALNHVSIPEQFVKVAYDPVNKKGIGFIMPNQKNDGSLDDYAVSIDEVEKKLGLDLFRSLGEEIEKKLDKALWFDSINKGDVDPIYQPSLPRNHFNTTVGSSKVRQKVAVCGKVVGSRNSKKGHIWMNLDKQFPNHVFSVMIRKTDLVNFDSDPKKTYANERICVNGLVKQFDRSDPPLIEVKKQSAIKFYKIKAD